MWETDACGTRLWMGPEGWTITVFTSGVTYVNEPVGAQRRVDNVDVEVNDGNISVRGANRGYGYEGDSPAAVELPFELLAEVLRLNGYTVTRNE